MRDNLAKVKMLKMAEQTQGENLGLAFGIELLSQSTPEQPCLWTSVM